MRRIWVWSVGLGLVWSPIGSAQPAFLPLDLTERLDEWIEQAELPGVTAAVARDDGLIAQGAAGVRHIGNDVPIDVDDRFHIGSCTKVMSTTLLALLVRDDVLRWEMTMVEALPALAGDIEEGYADRTLLDLARDRAGIPALSSGAEPLLARLRSLDGSAQSQREDLARLVLTVKPRSEGFAFSNASVPIATAIAESWSGQSWEELVARRVFDPLEMDSAGFGWPATGARRDEPRGHVPTSDGLRTLPLNAAPVLPTSLASAVEIHCSASDLARFGVLHLAGLRGIERENLPLGENAFRLMHDPAGQGYAMGWMPRERGDRLISMTMGTTGAFVAILIVDAPRNVTVAVCANSGGARGICETIAQNLLDEFGPID